MSGSSEDFNAVRSTQAPHKISRTVLKRLRLAFIDIIRDQYYLCFVFSQKVIFLVHFEKNIYYLKKKNVSEAQWTQCFRFCAKYSEVSPSNVEIWELNLNSGVRCHLFPHHLGSQYIQEGAAMEKQ